MSGHSSCPSQAVRSAHLSRCNTGGKEGGNEHHRGQLQDQQLPELSTQHMSDCLTCSSHTHILSMKQRLLVSYVFKAKRTKAQRNEVM